MALDTTHIVQTPEGVDLELRVAGPVARSLALLFDVALRIAAYIMLTTIYAFASFGSEGVAQGLLLISLFVGEWFYPVFFEVLGNGQTPGKRMMGLRVVHENGTPVTWPASILRNFLRVADALPGFYLIGLATMLVDSSFRRLGDLAAGTLVVYTEGVSAPGGAIPEANPLPPPHPLLLAEQRAVIAFAERSPYLTDERADELASIPKSLVGIENPRVRLFRIAAHLVGHHPAEPS